MHKLKRPHSVRGLAIIPFKINKLKLSTIIVLLTTTSCSATTSNYGRICFFHFSLKINNTMVP
jgi:hypothetical protein